MGKKAGHFKGYQWISLQDLSIQLGKPKRYVTETMSRKRFRTVESFLIWYLDAHGENATIKTHRSGSYRGYTWISLADLSRQLGKQPHYASDVMNNRCFEETEEFLDWYLDKRLRRIRRA